MNINKIKANDLIEYQETQEERAERETNLGFGNHWTEDEADEEYTEILDILSYSMNESLSNSESLNKASKVELINELIISLFLMKENIIKGEEVLAE